MVTTFDAGLPYLQTFRKYSQDGDLMWNVEYPDQRIRSIADAGNGDVLVLGYTSGGNYIQKVDPSNNVIWEQTFTSNEIASMSKILLAENNDIIIQGTKEVGRLDGLGNILWIDDSISGANLYFNNITGTVSNDLLITAQRWNPATSTYSFELLKVDGNGNLINTQTYPQFNLNYYTSNHPMVIELPDGNILLAGITSDLFTYNDLGLLKNRPIWK